MKLITELLEFTDKAQEDGDVSFSSFNVATVLDETICAFQNNAKAKQLSVYASIDESVPQSLYGNLKYLSQTLHFLLDNAIKYSDHGEIKIEAKIIQSR